MLNLSRTGPNYQRAIHKIDYLEDNTIYHYISNSPIRQQLTVTSFEGAPLAAALQAILELSLRTPGGDRATSALLGTLHQDPSWRSPRNSARASPG
jgi:hypothetical protein